MNTPDAALTDLAKKLDGLEGAAELLKLVEALHLRVAELETLAHAFALQVQRLGQALQVHQKMFESLAGQQPKPTAERPN